MTHFRNTVHPNGWQRLTFFTVDTLLHHLPPRAAPPPLSVCLTQFIIHTPTRTAAAPTNNHGCTGHCLSARWTCVPPSHLGRWVQDKTRDALSAHHEFVEVSLCAWDNVLETGKVLSQENVHSHRIKTNYEVHCIFTVRSWFVVSRWFPLQGNNGCSTCHNL